MIKRKALGTGRPPSSLWREGATATAELGTQWFVVRVIVGVVVADETVVVGRSSGLSITATRSASVEGQC